MDTLADQIRPTLALKGLQAFRAIKRAPQSVYGASRATSLAAKAQQGLRSCARQRKMKEAAHRGGLTRPKCARRPSIAFGCEYGFLSRALFGVAISEPPFR